MKSTVNDPVRERLDTKLAVIKPMARLARPPKGWIRVIRNSLGMTGPQLASRLGMTAQGVASMERSEAEGKIQICTLRRAAEAMDCVLVYALVPRGSLPETPDPRDREAVARTVDDS